MPGGRPTKLTPTIQQKVVDAVRAGNYMETAAAYAGIHKSTFFEWMKRGARSTSGIYRNFVDAIEKAMADGEARDVALIAKAASDGVWQASAWRLERKYPEKWGRRDTVNANVRGAIAHAHVDLGRMNLANVTNEELEAVEKVISKMLVAPRSTSGGGSGSDSGGEGTP